MSPKKFPEGSGVGDDRQIDVAAVRAVDSCMRLIRTADLLCDAMDEMTMPGVVRYPMDDEDSLVIAIRDLGTASDVGEATIGRASGKKPEMGG